MTNQQQAAQLLEGWKRESYRFGSAVLDQIGKIASGYGSRALVVSNTTYLKPVCDAVLEALAREGVELAGGRIVPEAAPNAPREDVYRIESYILHHRPDCVISIGGGSAIDAVKAACVLASLGQHSCEIDSYFGTGLVTEALKTQGTGLIAHIAIQTSASSGAHLTKYSNITDPVRGQKKLIVDEAIIPTSSLFDYSVTTTMPIPLTIDGALDAIAHCLEVFYGAHDENFDLLEKITATALNLVLEYTPRILADPKDLEAREAIGLATDLGGYAIMIGGTNGAHLTSFSLVDLTSHGRACGLMNPYYTVFFAPAIERQLRLVQSIFASYGYKVSSNGDLGMDTAIALQAFSKAIGSPVTLKELPGFSRAHIDRALSAAKDPQLKMKLQNMPVSMRAEEVDQYMKPILEAAVSGDLSLIRRMDS